MAHRSNPQGVSRTVPVLCLACTLILLLAHPAPALIEVGYGNSPVHDRNWPAGSVELGNLKTRVAWWEGPPFGGGQSQFVYRGDTAGFQAALDLFARIRAPELQLAVHEGPHDVPFLKDDRNPNAPTTVDWTFTVWDAESWHGMYSNPNDVFFSRDPNGGFRRPVDPPRLDVYVAGGAGAGQPKGIDWGQVKVPTNVGVTDERATAAGYAPDAASVVRGDVYDLSSSKPIPQARVVVTKRGGQDALQEVASATADANGHFEVTRVPPGAYAVSVSAEGYAPRVLGYAQFGSNTLKAYTAYLAKPASIKGTVLDTDGKPVAGAKVLADSAMAIDGRGYLLPGRLEAVADSQGRFELTGLPQGYLRLLASDSAHQPLDVLKVYSAPTDSVIVRMTATGAIKGRVLRGDGKPAGDAQVSVWPTEGEQVGKWGGGTNVKPDGSFQFDNVPPGRYSLSTNPDPSRRANDPGVKTVEVKVGQTAEVELTKK